MFEGRIVISVVMLAIFAGMVGHAATFPADARLLPWVIGIPGTVLCLIQFVNELRARDTAPAVEDPAERRREWVTFGWFVGFIVSILLFGFIVGGPLAMALYLWIDWKEKPLSIALSVAIAVAILYGVFEYGLNMQLFPGLLLDDL